LLAAAGCGAAATPTPATPTPATPTPATPTPATPTPTAAKAKPDAYARQACAKLDSAVDKRSNGDPTGADQDEFSAVTDAMQSKVAGLRKIAAKYPDALDFDKAAPNLRAWCDTNAPNG
jgi:hypothetical protein